MIGQEKNIKWVNTAVENDKVPKSIVIIGPKGSGKRTMAKFIAQKLNCVYAPSDIKVDAVRQVIDTAYKTTDNVLYCFENADNMKNAAKNALLKVTEEAPAYAWFVMTLMDDSTLLPTIKSRSFVMNMQPYTAEDKGLILSSLDTECKLTLAQRSYFIEMANTPYELQKLFEYGQDFLDYVEMVADNISVVESANAFKSGNKLALKSNAEGYDLSLFMLAFVQLCIKRITEGKSPIKYASGIPCTNWAYRDSMKLGVNKQQLFDWWVFKLRSVWYDFD